MSTPDNPYLLGYTDTRYSVDPLDVATREELDNPAVADAVVSDLAKLVTRQYEADGYRPSASVLRRNGRASRRYGRIAFPDVAPPEGESVLLVDPDWWGVTIPSPWGSMPETETLWAMVGAPLPPSLRYNHPEKLYRPLWLDLQTGQWLAFTNVPHEYTEMPRTVCRPYLGHARGYIQPGPPDPEAKGRVQYLYVKAPASRYAALDINTR